MNEGLIVGIILVVIFIIAVAVYFIWKHHESADATASDDGTDVTTSTQNQQHN